MKTGKALGHQNLSNIKFFLKSIDRKEENARKNKKKNPIFFLGHGLFSTQTLKYFFFIPRVYHMEYHTYKFLFKKKKRKIVYFSVG